MWPEWFPAPPAGQALPRIMTAPHPRAVGSYGPELLEWARPRFGMHPKRTQDHRWWQQLVVCAALQHDADGQLLFRNVLLGAPRQLGKSWLLRELCMWRIEQAERFGELQTVVHAAAKLSQAEGVWKPAALWASRLPATIVTGGPTAQPTLWDQAAAPEPRGGLPMFGGYEVRKANGSAQIARPDGSAWIPQAANDQLGVSLSVSLAIVDEAWDVPRWIVDNGLVPTQASAASSQLWIVSTAGKPITGDISDLYPFYRADALEQLEDPDSDLIIEWSADPDADPADPATWQQASPYWDDAREAIVAKAWRKAAQGGTADVTTFRMQWLNQWPNAQDAARWISSRLTENAATQEVPDVVPAGAVAAVETAYSDSSSHAVAIAWPAGDRVMARVWILDSLPAALQLVGTDRTLWAHLAVAESIGTRRWKVQSVATAQARAATGTLRQLLRTGRLAATGVPDEQWAAVKASPADGGEMLDARKSKGDIHAVKALAWAVWAVESGRSHTGFLFGAPPDEAQPGALTA